MSKKGTNKIRQNVENIGKIVEKKRFYDISNIEKMYKILEKKMKEYNLEPKYESCLDEIDKIKKKNKNLEWDDIKI